MPLMSFCAGLLAPVTGLLFGAVYHFAGPSVKHLFSTWRAPPLGIAVI